MLRFACAVLAMSALLDAGSQPTREASGSTVRRFPEPAARVIDVTFDLEEFCSTCEDGTCVPHPRGVSIFVTEWMWGVSSINPRRRSGNYVVGRWFTYQQLRCPSSKAG